MVQIILIICLALTFVMHFLFGNVPLDIFAFPLNVILLTIWLTSVLWAWTRSRKSQFVKYMLSPGATISAISLMLVFCFAIALTGMRWLTCTWPFIAVMLHFLTVLTFVSLRGWRSPTPTGTRIGSIRWRFIFLHFGLIIALSSAFWGAPDNESVKLRIFKNMPSAGIRLLDFQLDTYENGSASDYRAIMEIDGKEISLRVNHPYSRSFAENIYLSGYDVKAGSESEYCIIQIVRDPWKYGIVTGIIMIITGAFLLFIAGPRRKFKNDRI